MAKIGAESLSNRYPASSLEALVDADLDTLATAPYVRVDDLLKANSEQGPPQPAVGIAPRISDAELVTLAVPRALLGRVSEARLLRYAADSLTHLFPYLPRQPGYNKRLRKLTAPQVFRPLCQSRSRNPRSAAAQLLSK